MNKDYKMLLKLIQQAEVLESTLPVKATRRTKLASILDELTTEFRVWLHENKEDNITVDHQTYEGKERFWVRFWNEEENDEPMVDLLITVNELIVGKGMKIDYLVHVQNEKTNLVEQIENIMVSIQPFAEKMSGRLIRLCIPGWLRKHGEFIIEHSNQELNLRGRNIEETSFERSGKMYVNQQNLRISKRVCLVHVVKEKEKVEWLKDEKIRAENYVKVVESLMEQPSIIWEDKINNRLDLFRVNLCFRFLYKGVSFELEYYQSEVTLKMVVQNKVLFEKEIFDLTEMVVVQELENALSENEIQLLFNKSTVTLQEFFEEYVTSGLVKNRDSDFFIRIFEAVEQGFQLNFAEATEFFHRLHHKDAFRKEVVWIREMELDLKRHNTHKRYMKSSLRECKWITLSLNWKEKTHTFVFTEEGELEIFLNDEGMNQSRESLLKKVAYVLA